MPTIEINKTEFESLLGQEVKAEKLRDEASLLGAHWTHSEGKKWEVEVYPDRPDLLSVEGLARAYRGFFDIETGLKKYDVEKGELHIETDDSVKNVRPHIGGAVVRNLELDQRAINGLIQLQEKIHESMGRRRDKLAIGLHDLSSLEPPFTYKAVEPGNVSFTPLENEDELDLGEILEEHEKGKKYSWILEDEDKYPIIVDSKDQVLSFPPIINNQLTEVDIGTHDIFIDVTGKHKETVRKALNILTTALGERGGDIETVTVDEIRMPLLNPESETLDTEYFREISGLELEDEEIIERLEKMKFGTQKRDGAIKIDAPCYRNDLMHQYDLIEDVVIAHGYQNVEPELPELDQIGEQKPIEDLSDRIREILAGAGAMEANTYYLSSKEKLFDKMGMEQQEIVEMSNALNENFSAMRNWLLPSLMSVLQNNRQHSYPQEFFETADVAVLDDSAVGSSNKRKLAYVVSDEDMGYTSVKQTLQVLERDLGVEFEVKADQKPFMVPNRSADIFFEGEKVGFIGEIDRKVIENWELDNDVSGFEIDLDKLMGLK